MLLFQVLLLFLSLEGAARTAEAPLLGCWDTTDEELFVVFRDSDPKFLKVWVTILSRSETPAKRGTCAWALGYDRCFFEAPEIFGKDYRVEMLKALLEDKDIMVRRCAIQACQSVLKPEAAVLLPVLEKMRNKEGVEGLEKKDIDDTIKIFGLIK